VPRVLTWYAASPHPLGAYEAALIRTFAPRWNRGSVVSDGPLPPLAIESADAVVGLLDSPEQLVV
jgi:hypothetical protein